MILGIYIPLLHIQGIEHLKYTVVHRESDLGHLESDNSKTQVES